MRPHQPLPNPPGNPPHAALARELALMLGPAWQPVYEADLALRSLVAIELLAEADALQATIDLVRRSLLEAFPDTARALLPEWESRLGLPIDPTQSVEARQRALVAKVRALLGAQPVQIETALSALTPNPRVWSTRALDVLEEPRRVFVIVVTISAEAWGDPAVRERALEVLAQMVPTHVLFELAVTVGFRCDDEDSLTDRDVLED